MPAFASTSQPPLQQDAHTPCYARIGSNVTQRCPLHVHIRPASVPASSFATATSTHLRLALDSLNCLAAGLPGCRSRLAGSISRRAQQLPALLLRRAGGLGRLVSGTLGGLLHTRDT